MKILSYVSILVLAAGCSSVPLQKQSHSLPFAEGQVWNGSYVCTQGTTSLDLRIQNVSSTASNTELGPAYDISAVFDFDFNNRSAAGAFYLSGKYFPEKNVATFEPTEWIKKPSGYTTVGLDGLISSNGTVYAGRVVHPSCKGFRVNLIQ